ncbi:MAG: GntR family transcriptional regulator, partial [Candidatus Dormibacteria bacterium]
MTREAATSLFARLPARARRGCGFDSLHDRESTYERVAAELRAQIASGKWAVGLALPTHKQLFQQYGISAGTAHRVSALLSSEGLVDVGRCPWSPGTVVRQPAIVDADQDPSGADDVATRVLPGDRHQQDSDETATAAPQLWVITVHGPDGR